MLCDPLTKAGGKTFADRLIDCMQSRDLSLEPTVESQMRKMKQKKGRDAKAQEKRDAKELGDWPSSTKKSRRIGNKKVPNFGADEYEEPVQDEFFEGEDFCFDLD